MAKEEKIEETEPVYEFHYRKHSSHLGAFFFIFIGLVLLLSNLGLLSSDVWNQLWKFWPLLIVLLGVQMLFGKSSLGRLMVTLLTLFILAGVLAYVLISNGLLVLPPLPPIR